MRIRRAVIASVLTAMSASLPAASAAQTTDITAQTTQATVVGQNPACQDHLHIASANWYGSRFIAWRYNAANAPRGITPQMVWTAMHGAFAAAEFGKTRCPTSPYTNHGANITDSYRGVVAGPVIPAGLHGACPPTSRIPEGLTIAWGTTTPGDIADTCLYWVGAPGSDHRVYIALNPRYHFFTSRAPTGCSLARPSYDLQSILAHELGHVLGLGDIIDGRHWRLVMYKFMGKTVCTTVKRVYAVGDLDGMIQRYGRRP